MIDSVFLRLPFAAPANNIILFVFPLLTSSATILSSPLSVLLPPDYQALLVRRVYLRMFDAARSPKLPVYILYAVASLLPPVDL